MSSRRRGDCAPRWTPIGGVRTNATHISACAPVPHDGGRTLPTARYYLWLPRGAGMTTCELRPCPRGRWAVQALWIAGGTRHILERSALVAFVDHEVSPIRPADASAIAAAGVRMPAAGERVAACLERLVASRRTIARVTCCISCGAVDAAEAASLPTGWSRASHGGQPLCPRCACGDGAAYR